MDHKSKIMVFSTNEHHDGEAGALRGLAPAEGVAAYGRGISCRGVSRHVST